MNARIYLLSRKFKNRFFEIIRRPSELVALIIFVLAMALSFFLADREPYSAGRDANELYAIVFALYAYVFATVGKAGFADGASMFSMADVNLLLTAPEKPRRLLNYGLLAQFGKSMRYGFFIFLQYFWIHDVYGTTVGGIIAIFFGYAATAFLSLTFATLVYSFVAGESKRGAVCKALFYAATAGFAVYAALSALASGENLLLGLVAAANSTVMNFFPIAGFVRLGTVGFISGDKAGAIIGIVCAAIYCAAYYMLICKINSDYYEDVSAAAEVSFSAITARREGKTTEYVPKNVKVGKTGFKSGAGASAIAAKHKIENRRGGYIGATGIALAIVTIVFAFISKSLFSAFIFNVYLMIFTVDSGRWTRELNLPYVYLIPEPPFKKLLNMLRERFPSALADSFVTFAPIFFFADCEGSEILGCMISKVSYAFLFVGANLVMQRIFGSAGNRILLSTFYLFGAFLLSAPGLAAYLFISFSTDGTIFAAYAAMTAVNAAVATITIFCCRNVLELSEYNNR